MTLFETTSSLRDWAATIRKWKQFRQQTGKWPLFSIVASLLHTIVLVVGGVFLIWYGDEQGWSKNRFALILLGALLPFVFVWAWLHDKIYLSELRRARRQMGSNSEFEPGHGRIHHKSKTEAGTARKDRERVWNHLVSSSGRIDSMIFMTFLVFVAAAIIAEGLVWLLGW
jgi:hypothetical protein